MPAARTQNILNSHVRAETLVSESITVAAPGTAEQLNTNQNVYEVFIQAPYANVGDVYVGGPTVSSANGVVLDAGDRITVSADNLNQVWIDVSMGGEGVRILYYKP
jgi:hypothetical protein